MSPPGGLTTLVDQDIARSVLSRLAQALLVARGGVS
jgi:hypothetical protein